jgi:uncharacterized protein (DUF58 family)
MPPRFSLSFMPAPGVKMRLRTPAFLWALPILTLAALFLPGQVWGSLLIGWGGLMLSGYLWTRGLARGIRADRHLRFGWAAVGDRLSEQFELYNDSVWPALWVELIDDSTLPGYQASVVHGLGAGQTMQWRHAAVCQRRGQFRLGPWRLRVADPLGIFEATRHYDESAEIVIHPPTQTELPMPLPAGSAGGQTRARRRSWQASANAATVRDYHPNDPLRWVHWPTTARRNELFVREFDLDAGGDVWLLLDLATAVQLGVGGESAEEQIILLAAALAAQALKQNRAVGLAIYGRSPQLIPPTTGEGQQWRLLRALAIARADGETSLATALQDFRHTAGRGTMGGATAVIITPSADPDWLPHLAPLARNGLALNLILLERSSFGDDLSSQPIYESVRRLGFYAYLLRKGEIRPPPLDESQRRGFWEFRTLATGKVITVKKPDVKA